jgi:hypothetical protein
VTVNSGGGSGADTITLGDAVNSVNGILAQVTVNAAATDALTLNDQGSAAARTYTVTANSVTCSGGPVVNYNGVGALVVNGGSGGNLFPVTSTSPTAALTVNGGAGNNTLTGSNTGNFWDLSGLNGGTLAAPAYASGVQFGNIQNVTAGSGGDTFHFEDGAAIAGNLTGGGGDTLDYSAYTTSVTVDLQPGIASGTGVGGSVSGITTVDGGSGAAGTPGLYNLLIGNGGDTLQGGTGRRNILVAGGGASTLVAGDGEDLLIGGSTAYDTQVGLANWQAIAGYWAGTDPFATRVANLATGTGVPILDPTAGTGNVFGNGGGNTLAGNGALALLYTDGQDNVAGFDPGAQQVLITP